MTSSMEKALQDLTATTIRVQPVDPPPRTEKEKTELAAQLLFGIPALLALSSWFLMLGIGTVHDMWPNAVPAVGFWQAVTLVLGLFVVGNLLKPRAFRWARR